VILHLPVGASAPPCGCSHHCASPLRILQRDECAILGALEVDDYREVRRSLIGAVLATD